MIYGESLGTGVATEIAQKNNFAGVILESPFTSMIAAAKSKYPIFPIKLLLKDKYESDKKIKNIKIAYGGMAAIPKRAVYCEKILLNSNFSEDIILKAQKSLEKDFQPINDMRASKDYRMEIAKNLLNIAVTRVPHNADFNYNLALIYSDLDNYDFAEKHYTEAIRLNPNMFAAHNNLGNIKEPI